MSYATIDALRESLARPTPKPVDAAYAAKMLHAVPPAPVVDREKFIASRCKGKRVLELGASGALTVLLREIAGSYLGIDRQDGEAIVGYDLDDVENNLLPMPDWPVDVIVCGEVLEHLSNPGYVLKRLRAIYAGVPVIVTVPNAFCSVGLSMLKRDGVENVNGDHVAWYSYRTLKTLLERYGYAVEAFCWYTGEPLTAEGLIMVAR